MNKLLLGVETSGRMGSVAVALGDKTEEKRFSGVMRHNAELFGSIEELLKGFSKKACDIAEVYISVGPGSFTGLRIAVTLAKMMQFARGVKIVAVDTLDVIAGNITESDEERFGEIERLAAVLDAKRGEFFIGVYEKTEGVWERTAKTGLMSAEEFKERFCGGGNVMWLVGEGLVYYKEKLACDGVRIVDENCWEPRASMVLRLGAKKAKDGRYEDGLSLKPSYIREVEIGKKKKTGMRDEA